MKDAVNLRLGQVLAALPAANTYLTNIIGKGTAQATALGTGSDTRSGHKSAPAYMPGSYVLVMDPHSWTNDSSGRYAPYVILGTLPLYPRAAVEGDDGEITDDPFISTDMNPDDQVGYSGNRVYQSILQAEANGLLLTDRGYNFPDDIVPGTWAQLNSQGGMFKLAEFTARAGVSTDCSVNFTALDARIAVICRQFELDTGFHHSLLLQRGPLSLNYSGTADSLVEGLGGFAGSGPYIVNQDDMFEPSTADQRTFLRQLSLLGGVTEGEYRVHRTPLRQTGALTYDSEMLGLLSVQQRNDGIYRVRAAQEIRMERTSIIPVPIEKKDIRTAELVDPEEEDAPGELYEILGFSSEEELRQVQHLLEGEDAATQEADILRPGLRVEIAQGIWVVHTRDAISQSLFEEAPDTQLAKLPPEQPEYDLGDVISEEIEAYPGRQIKLFKNSSAFIMNDGGDVVLSDGFGAEIRMSKGRLQISSAADVIINPGRDIHLKAGRNLISQAGKRVELTSAEGSVAIKAEENLQLLGGNGGSGLTLIENRASSDALQDIAQADIESGAAISGGIMLRASEAGVATYADWIYTGGVAPTDKNTAGTGASCSMLINAGEAGDHMIMARNTHVLAHEQVGQSLVDGTAIQVLSNAKVVTACRGTHTIVAQNATYDGTTGSITLPKLTATGFGRNARQSIAAGPPTLVLQDGLLIRGDTQIDGTMRVNNISSRDGINGNLPLAGASKSSFNISVPKSQASATRDTLDDWAQSGMAHITEIMDSGAPTDKGQTNITMAFPKTESETYTANQYTITQAPWQRMLIDSGTWQENTVAHAIVGETKPYPGKAAYDRDDVIIGLDQDGEYQQTPLDDYKTNY